MPKPGHVSLWHPWLDTPGISHTLALWRNGQIIVPAFDRVFEPDNVNDIIKIVGRNKLYVLCEDILDRRDLPEELVRHPATNAFMSRTGNVVALECRSKSRGYFIPAKTWSGNVDFQTIENIGRLFEVCGYEAITPASLSEKIFRSTLPERSLISRPSDTLRTFLLNNSIGGRIDQKETLEFFPVLKQVDINKCYLFFSRSVPTPFEAPYHLYYGKEGNWHDNRWRNYECSFMLATMRIHLHDNVRIHPIQIKDNGVMRKPMEGETFTRGMFDFEIEDCLTAGYELLHIEHGYAWPRMSDCMVEWSNILTDSLAKYQTESFSYLFKKLMVSLPGRFLKSPETFTLFHEDDEKMQDSDIGILYNRINKDGVQSPWFMRPSYDLQSAQLTAVGMYIVARARQYLYHLQCLIEKHGGRVLSGYIDGINYTGDDIPFDIGINPGQVKIKEFRDGAYVVGNMIIPKDIEDARMPSISGEEERRKLYEKLYS